MRDLEKSEKGKPTSLAGLLIKETQKIQKYKTYHKPGSAVYQMDGGRCADCASRFCCHFVLESKDYLLFSGEFSFAYLILAFYVVSYLNRIGSRLKI